MASSDSNQRVFPASQRTSRECVPRLLLCPSACAAGPDIVDRNLIASSALLMAFAHVAQLAPTATLALHQRATALHFAGQTVFSKSYDGLVELFTVRV